MVTQVIECLDESQARMMAEFLMNEGDVLAWGDRILEEIDISVDEVTGYAEVDYDQWDVDEAIGN